MKTDKLRESQEIEDRRGQRSPGMGGHSSGGGLLLQLLLSRGSWKTKIIILLIFLFFGGMTSLGGLFSDSGASNYQSARISRESGQVSDQEAEFISKVLASTEDFWTEKFSEKGLSYQKPRLVFYTGQTSTACGQGQASSGPFYCSADRKIYIDLSFYQELSDKYGASGDFAMAYVIAHEVGHHVQNELGTMSDYHSQRQGLSQKEANALNVRLELQADYYAGAWAKHVDGKGLLDADDVEEALAAAHAVGDDHLQEKAYGRSMPDSFTHGTSQQRKRWFNRGFQYGDLEHADSFSIPADKL